MGVRVDNVSSRAVSLSWQPPPISTQNGIIQEYKMTVRETRTKAEIYLKSQTPKMTVDNLHPYFEYQISVAAVTVDVGPYETITITTLQEGNESFIQYNNILLLLNPSTAPSGPPQELRVLSVTSTNVTLSWVPPSFLQQNGVIRGYSVGICYPDYDSCWSEMSITTHYTVTGLHPFFTYHINVAAVTVDSGPPTGYKTVTCLEDGV